MWFYKLIWKRLIKIREQKSKGFTLIEMLMTFTAGFILMVCFSLLLRFTIDSNKVLENNNEILLNARYALEYIKQEIRLADMIISADKFDLLNEKYETNFGFVVVKINPNDLLKYNYSTYYFKDNKIIRIATNTSNFTFPNGNSFGGFNVIAEYINSIEGTAIDFNNRLIKITLMLEGKNKSHLNMTVRILCPIVY